MSSMLLQILLALICAGALSAQNGVRVDWVRYYASGLAPSRDQATAIAVDANGHVYVTGTGTHTPFGSDLFVIRYDPSGNELWSRRYSSMTEGSDAGRAIWVDSAGEVYVTGESWNGTDFNYLTLAYDSGGNLLWTAQYDGPANLSDKAVALAVDATGNVYVTGASAGSGTSYDYATVKYNQDGEQQWVARRDGGDSQPEQPVALALDGAGNVHITGSTNYMVPSQDDYLTVKYSADGLEQWIRRFDGGGHSIDRAAAIAVDATGNVIVSGSSQIRTASGDLVNYATVKYGPSGIRHWVAEYGSPTEAGSYATDLALDDRGNVYVTGGRSFLDYTTVKYNAAGEQQWTASYQEAAFGADWWTSMPQVAVDKDGNVFMAGRRLNNYLTVKYDSSGVEQWHAFTEYDFAEAAAMAIDGSGQVYVTGISSPEIGEFWPGYASTTIKYSASGEEEWAARHQGSSGASRENLMSVAFDQAGNIYMLGESWDRPSHIDYAAVKFSKSGEQAWASRYSSPGARWDRARAIAVDAEGNVYATGESERDFVTIKYNANGALQWLARYRGAPDSYQQPAAVAVDAAGNVYVTGWIFDSGGTDEDYLTIKYAATGEERWVRRYNNVENGADRAIALALDPSGNIYVTGWSFLETGGFYNYTTVKYNSSGEERWVRHYDGPTTEFGSSGDQPSALSVDGKGNVIVTGSSYRSWATVKYNSAGAEQWIARLEATPRALATDEFGNVYVTGSTYDGEEEDGITVKYTPSGVAEWIARYDGPVNETATALALDRSGNVYVAGSLSDGRAFYGSVIVKYDRSGIERWAVMRESPMFTQVSGISVDRSGNVFLAGGIFWDGWNSVFTAVKYVQTDEAAAIPDQLSLLQNYPNPFNATTTIRYQVADPGRVTLKVYNLLGQEVATLVDGNRFAGEYEVTWDTSSEPSGLYLYRLESEGFSKTQKMLLVK